MFDTFLDENSIKAIATSLPRKLVERFNKKEFYSPEEVNALFSEEFEGNDNIQYAYAMFCSPQKFIDLAQAMELSSSYSELRLKVSEKCFDGWPRFNFESLLMLTNNSSRSDLINEVTDISLDLFSGI